MKRFVTETASHKLNAIPEGPAKEATRDKVNKIIKACKSGLISEMEAVYLISRPEYVEQ